MLVTVAASAWTVHALSQLSRVAGASILESDRTAAATAALATALEREDDALLLVLGGENAATGALESTRGVVDDRLHDLYATLRAPNERALFAEATRAVTEYRRAADALAARPHDGQVLFAYHREANPLLREAVRYTEDIRTGHFEAMRHSAQLARDEAERTERVVIGISVGAALLSLLIALRLAGSVLGPVGSLLRGVRAVQRRSFAERIHPSGGPEFGELAIAFNQMAEHLAHFERTNLDEVVRAKSALEETLEALPEAVLRVDENGKLLSMNRTASELAKGSVGAEPPSCLADLGVPGLDERIKEELGRREEKRAASEAVDVALQRALLVDRGGARQRLLPRVVATRSDDGRRTAIVILYDVTDFVRLDETRSELVAVAAHELQTPLTTIRMSLLMLNEQVAGLTARQRELLLTSLSGVQQLGDTVESFLDLARLEAGQLRLDLAEVDVFGLARTVASQAVERARDAGVELSVALPDPPKIVTADARRLRAVLDNLLSNALKYTPHGGTIRLEGSADNGAVELLVIDTGPGIAEPYRELVFQKFFRVENEDPRVDMGVRGSGVGLYLCRQIVERHGGKIHCEAGPAGVGTKMVVSLRAQPGETSEAV
ncbi:MAG: ATP-binding protein [Polyangiaceae bacterium]